MPTDPREAIDERSGPLVLRRGARRSRARRVGLGCAVAVLAGGGAGAWAMTSSSGATPTAATYRLVAATTTTLQQTVSATGTLAPATTAVLSFGASGRVTHVWAQVGQRVTKGQRLAAIDSASLAAQVSQANASLQSAQARESDDEADTTATSEQLAADKAAVAAASSQVATAKQALAGATLASPIAGRVAAVGYTVGEQVSSGGGGNGSAGSGTASSSASSSSSGITVISDGFQVTANVDATTVGRLKVGDQAVITGTAASGRVYGTVSSIGLMATSSNGVTTFPVVIAVTGQPAGLYAGASVTAEIIYRQVSGVLAVPSAALHVVNGMSVVYELAGGKRVAKQVRTGEAVGGETQITAGLSDGEQVVVDLPPTAARSTSGSGGTGTQRGGFTRGGFGGFGGGGGFPAGGFTGGRAPGAGGGAGG